MFTINELPGAIPTLELVDSDAESRVLVAPSRGGMMTRFSVRDREILYLDERTLLDQKANVRGGNPVLFPSPGKLDGDAWSRDGKRGALKQHGFARNLAWSVVEASTSERSVRLRLGSTDST